MTTAALQALHDVWAGQLARIIRRVLTTRGAPVDADQRAEMARRLHPVVTRYRRRAYTRTIEDLAEQLPEADPASVRSYTPEALESVLERATTGPARRGRVQVAPAELDPQSRRAQRSRVTVTESNRTDPAVVRTVADRVSATVDRHVRQAGREAVVDTADDAGELVGWARVLTGAENCFWCAMLAGRGPVYRSEQSARRIVGSRGNRDIGEAFHDNCDCRVVPVRYDADWDGREQAERLEDLWARSTQGLSGRAARNAFRRAWALDQQYQDTLDTVVDGGSVPENSRLAAPVREALDEITGRDDRDGIDTAREAFDQQITDLNRQIRPDSSSSRARPSRIRRPGPGEGASQRELAERHLPSLRANLQKLLDAGRAEDSEPVRYHRRMIAKFESAL